MKKTGCRGAAKWLMCVALVAATLLAYLPALPGGFVWDDASWTSDLTRWFHNFSGLLAIWRHPTVLQQYYPVTGTSFWLDYQLWKFWTLPYHVENVLLHALAALLFWRLVLRLQIPGAWLAAALFTLHPVMVESAGWITERKNVLSLVFYLAALLAYLRYAQEPRPGISGFNLPSNQTMDDPTQRLEELHSLRVADPRSNALRMVFYSVAMLLFLAAMLSKTTAFSLPAVILLLVWWQRGHLRWRADVLPTLPFFALSLGLCAVTAWLEKYHVGAQGPDFALSFPERCLIAGRAFWFYLGKLLWPVHLCFVYPRWHPDPAVWWQWLYPVAALGLFLALWLARSRVGRGPVTALLFFVGTLFPVLGFMNAYGMRYSLVWDHWVYLSSLGPLALVAAFVARAAAGISRGMSFLGGKRRMVEPMFCGALLLVLGVLTWRQCREYADAETLWRTTIAKNPGSWMARINLGNLLYERGKPAEAEKLFREVLQLNPVSAGYADAYSNLGLALSAQGKLAEAMQDCERAIQIQPDSAENYDNLGITLAMQGRLAEATPNFDRAVQLKPDFGQAHYNLGLALTTQGRWTEGIQHLDRAVQLEPDSAAAHLNLGNALAHEGRTAEAMLELEKALRLARAQGDAALAEMVRRRLEK